MSSRVESLPRRRVRLGSFEPAAVAALKRLDPVIVVACLFASQMLYGVRISPAIGYLALFAFILSSPLLGRFDLPDSEPPGESPFSRLPAACSRVLVRWGGIVAAMLFLVFAFKVGAVFSRRIILTWFVITPAALCLAQAVRMRASWFAASMPAQRYIIVGVNEVGLELARRLPTKGFSGYFDFRSPDRISPLLETDKFAGHCRDLADYVLSLIHI